MKDYLKHEEYRVTYVDSWGFLFNYRVLANSYRNALRLARQRLNKRHGGFQLFTRGIHLRSVKIYQFGQETFARKKWQLLKVFK